MADEIVVEDVNPRIGAGDVLDALDDDKEESEDKSDEIELSDDDEEEVEEKQNEEDEEDEDKDDEEEVELDDDEDFELVEVPNRKAILAKFPDIFKQFPGIEKAIYRESAYNKVFSTPKEAESAREQLESFNNLQSDIFSGNIENLLTEVKRSDTKAFSKIADSLLDTMSRVDNPSFLRIANKVIKTALANVQASGKKLKERGNDRGEQYELAAQYLHEAIYGDSEITPPESPKVEEEDPKAKEVSRREQELNQRELTRAVQSVSSKATRTIKGAVEKYIDPKGWMSDYVKDKAISDVIGSVERDLQSDSRYVQHLDKLWADAAKNGYSEDSLAKINKAIINKTQTILKDHIKHVRAKALRNSTNKTKKVVTKERDWSSNTRLTPSTKSESRPAEKTRRVGGVADVMKALE